MPRAALQWLSLVVVIWLQSFNGTNSNFPAYSSQLKQLLSLSQLQLNNLALASDAGKLFGWFAGIAAIYLPLWLVLVIGSSLSFIGYGVQYLFLTHQIHSLSYWSIFFLTVLAGNGICWINTVCYLVTIHNFPSRSQAAIGMTTSYIGLSAVIYTAIVGALSPSRPSQRAQQYVLLNCVLPLIVSIISMPFLRRVDTGKPKRSVETGFILILLITIATGIFAVASSLGPLSKRPSSPWFNVIGVGACLMTPLLIPLVECLGGAVVNHRWFVNRETRVCDITTDDADEGGENWAKLEVNHSININQTLKEENCAMEDIGVILMVKRLNFWLYLFIYIFGATLGMVYLNNLGQIAESRGYSRTSSLVSLASAFLFFGRLLPSVPDSLHPRSKYVVPGPALMVVAMVPMAGAFFLLVVDKSSLCLHVSTAIIGLCTGAITAISVCITTELFGPSNFGINHNVVVANIPLGSFLFGDMAAVVYHKRGDGNGRCMGLECYSTTFVAWGSLCSLGSVLALVLYFRTRNFYCNLNR